MSVEALIGYRPRTDTEAADLDRIRTVLGSDDLGSDDLGSDDPWHRSTPLHLTASALILHPPTRRVLLRWHVRQQAWLQIGGHGDPGESDPLAIVLREGREETGLEDLVPWPDAALVHVVIVPVSAGRGGGVTSGAGAHEPAHEHADLRFVLATGNPDAARPENPAAPLRWLPLDEAPAATDEANLRETLTRVADLTARRAAP